MRSDQAPIEHKPVQEFKAWASKTFPTISLKAPSQIATGQSFSLQGPTGEENQYMILPRESVLSLAHTEQDQIQQILAILSVGSRPAVLAENTFVLKYLQTMPKAVAARFKVIQDIESGEFDAVLHHGDAAELIDLQKRIAARKGPIVGITHLNSGNHDIPVERLVLERAISINTAAAGGNASLMTMSHL